MLEILESLTLLGLINFVPFYLRLIVASVFTVFVAKAIIGIIRG